MMFSGKSKLDIVFFVGFRALLLILFLHGTGIRIVPYKPGGVALTTCKALKDFSETLIDSLMHEKMT